MALTETISASAFKAKCLNILDRLANHELDRVIITKRGKTVGVLSPPQTDAIPEIYGSMRGSVIIPEGFDAEQGILHR